MDNEKEQSAVVDVFVLFENGESLDIEDVDMGLVEFAPDGKIINIPVGNGDTAAYHINVDKVLYILYEEG